MSAGESKSHNKSNILCLNWDGYYYVDGLKITGVGWLIRDGSDKSNFCIENRVALTKDEQNKIGDKQPFMLNSVTYDKHGVSMEDSVLAKCYLDKMTSKGKGVKLTKQVDTIMSFVLAQIVEDAKKRAIIFKDRHFPMALLREAIKENEHPKEALVRGLKEECKKKFKDSNIPEHTFVYERRGNTALLIYLISYSALEIDVQAVEKTGSCNYFCAKSLPIINNDYLETKNHEILDNRVIEEKLKSFEVRFGNKGIGCDLKYWGGLKMWEECKKHF